MANLSPSHVKIFNVKDIVHPLIRILFPVFMVTHIIFLCPLLWYFCITRIWTQPEWYTSFGNLIFSTLGIAFIPLAIFIVYLTIWTWFGRYSFSIENDQLIVRKFIGQKKTKESMYDLANIENWSVRKDVQISATIGGRQGRAERITRYTCQITYQGKLVELLTNDSEQAPAELGAFLAQFMPDKQYHLSAEDEARNQH